MDKDFLRNYDAVSDVEKQFPMVWESLLAGNVITSQNYPIGVILGGQPGAGKSFATEKISNTLKGNVLIINGDEFRAYHYYFDEIGQIYPNELPEMTQLFANTMVNKIKNEAFRYRFNVVIEGTFRTTEVPLKELHHLKQIGYQTGIIICTCPKHLSWESTIRRGDEQKARGLPARYVSKQSHDITVRHLASNVEYVYKNAYPDFLEIYSRREKLFDSRYDPVDKIKYCIEQELNNVYIE